MRHSICVALVYSTTQAQNGRRCDTQQLTRALSDGRARVSMQTCLQHSCQPIHCRVTGRNSFTGRKLSQPAIRPCRSRQPQRCRAGLLWQPDEEDLPTVPEPKIVAPANAYGLSPRQIQALGLANDWRPQTTEAQEASIGMQPLKQGSVSATFSSDTPAYQHCLAVGGNVEGHQRHDILRVRPCLRG